MQKALLSVPGVRTADVDLEARQASVAYDPAKTKTADLLEAIKTAGFGAELKS